MFRRFLYYLTVTGATVAVLWALGPPLDDLLGLLRPDADAPLVVTEAPELPFVVLLDGMTEAEPSDTDATASVAGDELFIFGAPASGGTGSADVPANGRDCGDGAMASSAATSAPPANPRVMPPCDSSTTGHELPGAPAH